MTFKNELKREQVQASDCMARTAYWTMGGGNGVCTRTWDTLRNGLVHITQGIGNIDQQLQIDLKE